MGLSHMCVMTTSSPSLPSCCSSLTASWVRLDRSLHSFYFLSFGLSSLLSFFSAGRTPPIFST